MSSCNEENGEIKHADSDAGDIDETEAAINIDDTLSVQESEAAARDDEEENNFVVIENEVDEKPDGDIVNEVGDTENEAEKIGGTDDTYVMSDKENSATDATRHYDADDSCLSGTLDESTIEGNDGNKEGLDDGADVVDGTENGTVTIEKVEESVVDACNVESSNTEMEDHEEGKRHESKESIDIDSEENDAGSVASLQESSNNFEQQEFRSNSLVSETRMLTAVTEETEEELLELDKKSPVDLYANKSHSLEELKAFKWSEERMHHSAEQVYTPKDVVLRKGILKKDRPLSDNYENIKMIARESQINRLGKTSDSDDSATSLDKRKSKSLDMLVVDDENRKSPSLTSSQLSLSDIHGSVESMDQLETSNNQLYRTKSAGSGSFGYRASLTDITFSVRDDIDEPQQMFKKIKSRFSFKRKSKSTTALDKKGVELKDDGEYVLN